MFYLRNILYRVFKIKNKYQKDVTNIKKYFCQHPVSECHALTNQASCHDKAIYELSLKHYIFSIRLEKSYFSNQSYVHVKKLNLKKL